MKRRNGIAAAAVLAAVWGLTAGISGCETAAGEPAMYIEPAELSQEEESMAKLVGAEAEKRIYDFSATPALQSIYLKTYRLEQGKWVPESDGGQAYGETEGRLALNFDSLAKGMGASLQGKEESGSSSYEKDLEEEFAEVSQVTTVLEERRPFSYEEEIPLVIQVMSSGDLNSGDRVESWPVEAFSRPEEYRSPEGGTVYAVTVQFSRDPLD